MSPLPRLTALSSVAGSAHLPGYDPAAHGVGIVHIGIGAFHRAHQAVYTDAALAEAGGDWRIAGVSLRSTDAVDALNAQNGLYTLIERGTGGTSARIVGSIAPCIAASRDREALLAALADPKTRIVSLTVTEKAYGIDRIAGGIDPDHPAIAADLASPAEPSGTIGLLTEALRRRRAAGFRPFTALCCDNLPENGALLRNGVLDFAGRIDPALRDWIAVEGRFPSTMVDRITPASTDATYADAARLTGCTDLAAIETESFTQWVIEEDFADGRPAWEAGGALFVKHVAPFEAMKLRMLNGAHSMLAYSGFLSGRKYVRDVMADPALAKLVARQMDAAASTLAPLADIDYAAYALELQERFRNPSIAHETSQIAMDGTQKLPQRILAPAVETLAKRGDIRAFAFATAAWMRYATGRDDDGAGYALRDPREGEIGSALKTASSASDICSALLALPDLFPRALAESELWQATVSGILGTMLQDGMKAAIAAEVRR